jgi:hypothetical protein
MFHFELFPYQTFYIDRQFSITMRQKMFTFDVFGILSSISLSDLGQTSSPSDNEKHLAICHHDNENLLQRINVAIRHCIDFRHIHRLCEVKFEHRHYPSSIETLLIKTKLEREALNDYKQELEEFEKISEFNSSIDDEKCRMMFDQYVYLQRNYYYMIKLMKKTARN